MAGLLRLARPVNCVMAPAGVGIGGLVAVRAGAWGEFARPLVLAGAAAASFTAGGDALYHPFDPKKGPGNPTESPLPAGGIDPSFVENVFTVSVAPVGPPRG